MRKSKGEDNWSQHWTGQAYANDHVSQPLMNTLTGTDHSQTHVIVDIKSLKF